MVLCYKLCSTFRIPIHPWAKSVPKPSISYRELFDSEHGYDWRRLPPGGVLALDQWGSRRYGGGTIGTLSQNGVVSDSLRSCARVAPGQAVGVRKIVRGVAGTQTVTCGSTVPPYQKLFTQYHYYNHLKNMGATNVRVQNKFQAKRYYCERQYYSSIQRDT